MDAEQALSFAQHWLNAFNQRNLDSILSHYSDDVEFQSPLATKLLGNGSETIVGKARLREFFEAALAAFPGNPEIEQLAVFLGVSSLVIQFRAKGRMAAEVIELDSAGKIRRAIAHTHL